MAIHNVLFLCVGNSGLSLIAEKLLNVLGKGKFKAFSAGLYTSGMVNPFAFKILSSKGYAVDDLYSKDWLKDFGTAPNTIDFVFTVCEEAKLLRLPDSFCKAKLLNLMMNNPANVQGDVLVKHEAFMRGYEQLERIIQRFIESPLDTATLLPIYQPLKIDL
jgi:protein-tyrosine-phosphatase